MEKSPFKEKAIELRKKGLSFSEIQKKIPVSHSSLSFWLRDIKLSKKAQSRLLKRRIDGQHKGAIGHHNVIVREEKRFREEALKEIKKMTKKDLFLLGVSLYWVEGAKSRTYRISQPVKFSNSDPLMIKIFMKWLYEIIHIKEEELVFELYLHETQKCDNIIKFWAKQLNISKDTIRLYYKHNKVKPNRFYYIVDSYGVLMLRVRRSAALNRKISVWVETICNRCGVV